MAKTWLRSNWKNRLRNRGLWMSMLALIGIVVVNVTKLTTDQWTIIYTAGLGVLVALGLVNDPTTENCGLKDDPP